MNRDPAVRNHMPLWQRKMLATGLAISMVASACASTVKYRMGIPPASTTTSSTLPTPLVGTGGLTAEQYYAQCDDGVRPAGVDGQRCVTDWAERAIKRQDPDDYGQWLAKVANSDMQAELQKAVEGLEDLEIQHDSPIEYGKWIIYLTNPAAEARVKALVAQQALSDANLGLVGTGIEWRNWLVGDPGNQARVDAGFVPIAIGYRRQGAVDGYEALYGAVAPRFQAEIMNQDAAAA